MNYTAEVKDTVTEEPRLITGIGSSGPHHAHKLIYMNLLEKREEIIKILDENNNIVFDKDIGFICENK